MHVRRRVDYTRLTQRASAGGSNRSCHTGRLPRRELRDARAYAAAYSDGSCCYCIAFCRLSNSRMVPIVKLSDTSSVKTTVEVSE